MGLLSSNAPSFVVNSLNVQNNTFISPLVSKAIDLALDNIASDVPKYEFQDDDWELVNTLGHDVAYKIALNEGIIYE